VWLTDQVNARHWSAFELPFHRGERDRLVIADHFRLRVAGRNGNQERRAQTDERSRAQIKSGLDWMKSAERIKSSSRGGDEHTRHDRGELIMCELNECPGIQQV